MNRKEFIAGSAFAAAALTNLVLESCNPAPAPAEPKKAVAEAGGSNIDDFELNEATIGGLQERMTAGKLSSERLTQLYLNRINAVDKKGPTLNAVIELNPDALEIAKAMDAERKAGKMRGVLHGIPILIKDNIDTADKMQTTAGSLALAGNIAPADAFIVQRLRAAGAVILGKTNLSEWANFRSGHSSSGWSSRGGQTKNPYYLDRNPCGSSSGSGVAVSANLCAVAVGTETDGSVTCPASVNGVVGIKPTVGLLSRTGIIPISFTQDTAGPLARTVTDAAILLSAMTGVDPSDAKSKESAGRIAADYTQFLIPNGLKGKRIGVEKKKYENQFLNALLAKALDALRAQGAEVVEIEYLDKLNASDAAEGEVLNYEFKQGVNQYLAAHNATPKTLKDLIDFNKKNEDQVMPTFKQDIFDKSQAKGDLNSKEYIAALQKSHGGTKQMIDAVLLQNKLDAIAGLTMGPACAIDVVYGDRWGDVFLTSPAAKSGYPHISVPAGKAYDLPVGLSFFSGAYQEGALITIAYAYEQATKNRVGPEFKIKL